MQRVVEFFSRIGRINPKINALCAVHTEADVLRQLNEFQKSNSGEEPFVFVAKDNFCTKKLPTACASEILQGYVSPYEATAVKLLKESGGLMIAKSNMDEFAMGTDNSYSSYGQALNPNFEDPTSPGGSSGGSAAAVAAGLCDVSLGTDTGGSVRLPAAYCSVVGYKPTYGRISRYGVVSYAQSLDTVGILAKDVKSVRKTFNILDKYDENDPTSANVSLRTRFTTPNPENEVLNNNRKLKIGIIEETVISMHPDVRRAWTDALLKLEEQGHEIYSVNVPAIKHSLPAYFAISPAEASSNLARYDGVRYGNRAEEDKSSFDSVLYGPTRSKGFGSEVQRRILLGTFNMTAEAYEEHFLKAQKVRRLICDQLNALFIRHHPLFHPSSEDCMGLVDAVIHPTSPHLPPSVGDTKAGNPVEHYTDDVFTVPANLAGLPAISIPVAPAIGIQVWTQYGDDALAVDLAEVIHANAAKTESA